MKKRENLLLDLFLLLSLLEGLTGLFLALSIPGDPKNSLVLGLSLQRLLLAAALAGGTLAAGLSLFFHRRSLSRGRDLLTELFSHREFVILLHVLASLAAAVGLAALVWAISTSAAVSPAFLRLAPLLGWAGLTGLQGCLLLLWLDRRQEGYDLGSGLRWVFTTLAGSASAIYLAWLLMAPAKAGLFAATDLGLVGAAGVMLFFIFFEQKSRVWLWGLILLTFGLFLAPLIGIWASGVSDLNYVAGLFPFNDAHGYYLGARRLADGGTFHSFAAHRPLFPAFLAFLLGISSQNLQISIAVLVVLAAAAAFIFALEIKRTHGSLAASLALMLVFLFFRRFTGSVMTETQGLAMGVLAFAVLWRAVTDKKPGWFYIGLACLSIALNARAGPFFILPFLVLWAAWFFRKRGWLSWRVFVLAGLAVGVGFAGNMLIFRAAATEKSAPFSNFSYTLYGTAVGGKGWKQVFVDHPEISNLEEPEFSQRIYALAFDEIKRNPAGLIQGSLTAWKSMFSLEFYGMFGFVQGADKNLVTTVRLILFLISFFGLASALIRWRKGLNSFVLAGCLGVWLSVPFVPPLDAEIRTYAAVIPLFVILVCLGTVEIIHQGSRILVKKPGQEIKNSQTGIGLPSGWIGAGFALAFCAAAIFGPLLIRATARAPRFSSITCQSGEEAVYVRVNPGSFIQVVEDQSIRQTWLPRIRWTDFSKSIHDFPHFEITEELAPVAPPTTIAFTYNLTDGRHVWLIADSRIFPQLTGLFAVCGTWTKNLEKYGYGFFYGRSIQIADMVGSKDD